MRRALQARVQAKEGGMSRRKGETIKEYDLRRARETAYEQDNGLAHLREDRKFKKAMQRAGYEPVVDSEDSSTKR